MTSTTDRTAEALGLLAALVLENGERWGAVAADFQVADSEAIFSEDGPRWHFLTRPRGGSKTTDLAGVALVWLATMAAPGSRGVVFAGSRDQAAILLDAASGLVDRTPELRDAITVQAQKLIGKSGATVEIRSADADTAWGLRPSFCVVDELAQWPETRRARKLWTAIRSSLGKVPGCRFVCLTSAGEPGHWSHKDLEKAVASPDRWRVNEVPGPLPWLNEADLVAQGLRESEYARLHLNIWTQSEDRLVSGADLELACVLDGEQDAQPGIQYLITADIGLTNDRTVVAVGHAETVSDERGAPKRVVCDSIRRWRGTKKQPVRLEDIEAYLALTSARYNRATIHCDPWQAAGMIQRLSARGVHCEQWPFTVSSTGRLGQSLHMALKNGLLLLPRDDDLISELGRVRLKETGIGQARLDHDAGSHDDQAVVLGMLTAELIGNAQLSGAAAYFEQNWPTHSCGMPRPREATGPCTKCGEELEPHEPLPSHEPEPVAAQAQPWSPWSNPAVPQRPGDPAVMRTLGTIEWAKRQGYAQEFGSGWTNR